MLGVSGCKFFFGFGIFLDTETAQVSDSFGSYAALGLLRTMIFLENLLSSHLGRKNPSPKHRKFIFDRRIEKWHVESCQSTSFD